MFRAKCAAAAVYFVRFFARFLHYFPLSFFLLPFAPLALLWLPFRVWEKSENEPTRAKKNL
jgi:hypothetical protein